MKRIIIASALLLFAAAGHAQKKQDKDKAREYGYEAVKLLDNAQYEEAIELLEQASKLDGEDPVYSYEIAYAYYAQKQYRKTAEILESIIDHKKANDQYFQLLGNAYDNMKKPDMALATYGKGLARFPQSGKLYLESGIVEYSRKNYNAAIEQWEKGVQADPKFSSNYYWIAKVFSMSDEKVWTILYGEIFMNLERGSKRTEEISKLLYEAYKASIDIRSATEGSTHFSKNMSMSVPAPGEELKIPFEMHFDIAMSLGTSMNLIGNKKEVNIDFLSDLRKGFLSAWFQKDLPKNYPNVLLDYQQKLAGKGHLEAYTYWLMMKGNEAEFNKWKADKDNSAKYDAFIAWYKDNPLVLNDKNKFYRTQY
jgi:tetratricopeptide (TPR) repeat protein